MLRIAFSTMRYSEFHSLKPLYFNPVIYSLRPSFFQMTNVLIGFIPNPWNLLFQWFPTVVPFTIPRGAASWCVFQYIINKYIFKMPSNLKANCMGLPLGAANNFSLFSCLHLCAISLCPAKATRHHKGDNVECVRKLCCCCSNNNISFFSHLRPFKYQMSSSLLSCEVHVNLFVTIMSLSERRQTAVNQPAVNCR